MFASQSTIIAIIYIIILIAGVGFYKLLNYVDSFKR